MDYVIIVAGGKGQRMGAEMPKQFLPVGGRPILMHTLERFRQYCEALQIILVLPHEQQEHWRELCLEHGFAVEHRVVDGGATRFQSSYNGLCAIPDDEEGVVGIHDGVRPFVSVDVIGRCFETARKEKACIPVGPVTDTLRYIDPNGGGKNVQRSDYRVVQTPQTFNIALLKKAFAKACAPTPDTQQPTPEFTDDASVVEALGCEVQMVEGNRENIKITTPFDLLVAEALLKQ